MDAPVRQGILAHYGAFPEAEPGWPDSADGPTWTWWILAVLPLDPRNQIRLLSQPRLRGRLEGLQRVLRYLTSRHDAES